MGANYEALPQLLCPTQPRTSRRAGKLALSLTTFLFAACSLHYFYISTFSSLLSVQETSNPFSWDNIQPSKHLEWHACYTSFDCARLDVPLDWLTPSDDHRVVLAIIRLPASNLTSYRGPVFFNPGGPGGSGVFAMRNRGHLLQKIVGTNHDLITFDPRGVGATTPGLRCWESETAERIWGLMGPGVVDSHPGVVYDAYARQTAYSRACAANTGANVTEEEFSDSILHYISTASVARDMLEILTQLGEERLKYWGFSYGTYLGGVFAAMYPEKVERMVNDGNVNYFEWSHNAHHSFSIDADKVMDTFYTTCHAAGPEECAMYDTSPAMIEARVDVLLNHLKTHPIISPKSVHVAGLPEIVTYAHIRRLIATSLYIPVYTFPHLARTLSALEKGDASVYLSAFTSATPLSCSCSSDCPSLPSPPIDSTDAEGNLDVSPAVICADGGAMNDSIAYMEKRTAFLLKQSKAAGAVHAMSWMDCVGWRARAKWRFEWPLSVKTAHPVLFIGNMADNITPKRSAVRNSRVFEGSRLLVSNSTGVSIESLVGLKEWKG